MLIPLSQIRKVFDEIHQSSLSGGTTIWIFVSYDADSICSCIILSNILKNESILHKIVPIQGYAEL